MNAINPFAGMDEEINAVAQQMSGAEEPELSEVIESHHNELMQNIANRVHQTAQLEEAMEGVIQGLTDESLAINVSAPTRLQLEKLNGILTKMKQEQAQLTAQLKTSALNLVTLQKRTQELRVTAGKLKGAVRQKPPKDAILSADILMGGQISSTVVMRCLATKR